MTRHVIYQNNQKKQNRTNRKRFHLNAFTQGFTSQTQELELFCIDPHLSLEVKILTVGRFFSYLLQSHPVGGRTIMCKIQKQNFVSLNCTVVQGAPASTIIWSKEGNDSSGQRILTVQSDSNPGLWSSLKINNVMVKNAGRYKCEVKKDVFEDVCEVTLHVYCKFIRTTQYYKLVHLSLVMMY